MSTSPWFRLSLFCICLLLCGATVIAQESPQIDDKTTSDHGDAHQADTQLLVDVVPQRDRRPEPYVVWLIRSMGMIGVATLAAGAFGFVVTVLIVIRGQGPFACTALVLLVPMPLLLGVFGSVTGLIASFQVIAFSDATIKASEISAGITESLVTPMLGFIVMVPSYLVATLGSIFRSFPKSTAEEQ